jgi:hypothetical protein
MRELDMRSIFAIVSITVALAATPVIAQAAGCLKGAAVGGVAGHLAGHHGVAGAAIGCAVGHHQAKVKEKAAAQATAAQGPAKPIAPAPAR